MKILAQKSINEIRYEAEKGTAIDYSQRAPLAAGGLAITLTAMFAPIAGVAIPTAIVVTGGASLLNKFYQKHVAQNFNKIDKDQKEDMTEGYLVGVVDAILNGLRKGVEDLDEQELEEYVEEDFKKRFKAMAKAQNKVAKKLGKFKIVFEEHLIDAAEGSDRAKEIVKKAVEEAGMYSKDTWGKTIMRGLEKVVDYATSPADALVDKAVDFFQEGHQPNHSKTNYSKHHGGPKMRITKRQLKRIIKEEYRRILNEGASDHYNVSFTKDGVDVNKGTGGGAERLFSVMKGQQPYYGQIVKAARGDKKGMQALKDQIEEKDDTSNIKDGDITFDNRPMAESVSRDQLRNLIRQEYRNIVRENRRRRRY